MAHDFYIILDDRLAAVFEPILGTRRLPVTSPNPQPAKLEGAGLQPCYMLATRQLSLVQLSRLAKHFSQRSGESIDEVLDELLSAGLPIRARGCSVVIHNHQRYA